MSFSTTSARRCGILSQMHFPKLLNQKLNQKCTYTAGDSEVMDTCSLYGVVMVHVRKPTILVTVTQLSSTLIYEPSDAFHTFDILTRLYTLVVLLSFSNLELKYCVFPTF